MFGTMAVLVIVGLVVTISSLDYQYQEVDGKKYYFGLAMVLLLQSSGVYNYMLL